MTNLETIQTQYFSHQWVGFLFDDLECVFEELGSDRIAEFEVENQEVSQLLKEMVVCADELINFYDRYGFYPNAYTRSLFDDVEGRISNKVMTSLSVLEKKLSAGLCPAESCTVIA